MDTMKKLIKKYPLLFLLIAIFLTGCIAYFYYTIRGYLFVFQDIGSDTKELYLPIFESISAHLKKGDFSFWDLTYGLGTSMYNQNLFHPTMLLLYVLGAIFGVDHIASFMIVIHFLHILLSGLTCYLFLHSFRDLSLKSVLLISYIYSFNGYLLIWGQHYTFGLATVMLPLLLCMIEHSLATHTSLYKENWKASVRREKAALLLLVLVSAVIALSSYYFAYMTMLAAAFYTIFRLIFMDERFVAKLKLLVSRGLLMLLGVLMGVCYMLPSYRIMSENSSRIGSDYSVVERFFSMLTPYPGEYYLTFFKKLFSGTLAGNGSRVTDYNGFTNLYEDPQLFLTCLLSILGIQFLILLPKIAKTRRQRIGAVAAAVFTAFVMFIESGSLMFNGFVYPFSRHFFAVLPILALMMAFTLDHILKTKEFSLIGAGISAVYFLVICIISFKGLQYTALRLNAVILLLTGLAMIAAFLLYSGRFSLRFLSAAKVVPLLVLLVAVQLISETYSTVYNRINLPGDAPFLEDLYGDDVMAILDYIDENDASLFRTERTYTAGSTLMDAASNGYYGISSYNSTMNKNEISMFKELLPEALLMDSEYRPSYRPVVKWTPFERLFGIKYLITDDATLEVPEYEPVLQSGKLRLLANTDVTFAHFFAQSISPEAFKASTETISRGELLTQYLIVHDRTADIGMTVTELPAEGTPQAILDMPKPKKEGRLTCNATVPVDGYVLFPITCEDGWRASIDGESTEVIRADYGFMAVRTPAGSHVINLEYHVPFLLPSAIISLAAFILFLLVAFFIRRR